MHIHSISMHIRYSSWQVNYKEWQKRWVNSRWWWVCMCELVREWKRDKKREVNPGNLARSSLICRCVHTKEIRCAALTCIHTWTHAHYVAHSYSTLQPVCPLILIVLRRFERRECPWWLKTEKLCHHLSHIFCEQSLPTLQYPSADAWFFFY